MVSRNALKTLQTYLTTHRVWVKGVSGVSFAKVLYECLQEETRHEWTKEEIEEHLKTYPNDFNSRWNPKQLQNNYSAPNYPDPFIHQY
jgi:hypothetical protein